MYCFKCHGVMDGRCTASIDQILIWRRAALQFKIRQLQLLLKLADDERNFLHKCCVQFPMKAFCSLGQVLQPAIELAEDGFPVGPLTARLWAGHREQLLQAGGPGVHTFLPGKNKATPQYGQVFRNPDLGRTFRTLADKGALEGAGLPRGPPIQACP